MKYLFVDNFRGFSNTLFSINDVNFLVGENSSGKTSILSLINILDSPDFWFAQRFSTEEATLGNYQDIVSALSTDKSYFRIGIIDCIQNEKESGLKIRQAFLSTFVEEDGLPVLSKHTVLIDDNHITARFTPTSMQYNSKSPCIVRDDRTSILETFLQWVLDHEYFKVDSERIKLPFGRERALVYAAPILSEVVKGERKDHGVNQGEPPKFPGFRRPFGGGVWLAPIRTRPQRTYDKYRLDFSPDGEHTPYLIKKLLSRKTVEQRESADRFVAFIEKFGKASGLFESVKVKNYLPHSTTSPFELDVVLAEKAFSTDNVGYGVSQALPIIVELFVRPKGTWFAIQQPEIHLHPRAQTSIGEILLELAVNENKRFFVETHSDFTIDGFRIRYRDQKLARKPKAQIVYFERNSVGNSLYEIPITESGDLPELQPEGYREFFVKHHMRMLGY